MITCLDRISPKACLECLDWIPVISTATNLVHVFAKYAVGVRPGTCYGNYLHGKKLSEDLGLLIPLYNIYVKAQKFHAYSMLPHSEIEMPPIVGVMQQRRFPPLGLNDTVIDLDGEIVSYHTEGAHVFFMNDGEIETKEPYIRETEEGVRYTIFHKAIVQQKATRGCATACVEMLCLDHGVSPRYDSRHANLGDTESIVHEIQEAGLRARVRTIPDSTFRQPALFMESLRAHIRHKGSCIIGVESDEIGGHAIIVDHISECLKFIRIRDPYHGWEVTVKRRALIKKLENQFIQIES